MALGSEGTGTDWEKLKGAFAVLKKDLRVLALDTPQPDEPFEEIKAGLEKQVRRSGSCGILYFGEGALRHAKASGDLRLVCTTTQKWSVGHVVVMALFGMNASFALKDAESRALMRRVLTSLQVSFLDQGIEASWSGDIPGAIVLSGKWV